MKWITHEVVTGVLVFAAFDDPLLAVYSMAGAVFPDKVEGSPGSRGWSAWRSRHRGWSHWPMPYLLLLLLLLRLDEYTAYAALLGDLRTIGIFLCVGALLHIAEDGFCGKVPFILPRQKVGVRLFKVGSVFEYLFALAIVLSAYVLRLLWQAVA